MAPVFRVLRHLAKAIVRAFRDATRSATAYLAFLLSHAETGRMIVSVTEGSDTQDQLGPSVVVFAHFDRTGRIPDHTRAYVRALRAEGLEIVFVSNAGRLAAADLAWISGEASRILIRRNVGYDFAAWRDAMAECRLPAPTTELLVLANDSVYGPLHQLAPMLARIDFAAADVWGLTDSWQQRFHLQSFFLAFGPRALQHEVFGRFWRSVRNVRSKEWVVRRCEIGLTQVLTSAGLRCKAIWPYHAVIQSLRNGVALNDRAAEDRPDHTVNSEQECDPRRRADPPARDSRYTTRRILRAAARRAPLNPTADLWRVLIEQGFPFLKRELVRENPSRVPDVADWASVVDEATDFDQDLIIRDCERSLKNLTP